MTNEELNAFQRQLDEVLKDTNDFVNASRQLNELRAELGRFINSLESLNVSVNKIASSAANTAKYAAGFYNGDFTAEINKLRDEVLGIIASCSNQAAKLEKQYGMLLEDDSFKDLKKDHETILDTIDYLVESIKNVQNTENENSKKLDELLGRMR